MRTRYGVAVAVCLTLAGGSTVVAQNVVRLGEYHAWTAYTAGTDSARVCYVVARSTAAPNGGARYAYVTHRPAKKLWSVVTIYGGAPYREAAPATAQIGRSQFSLFTYRDTAWAPDADADARLVMAMRGGKSMLVRSVAADGSPISDEYSLTGFLAAYRRIGDACNLK